VLSAEVGGVTIPFDPDDRASGTSAARKGSAVLDLDDGRSVQFAFDANPSTGRITAAFQGPPDLDDPFEPTPFADFLPPNDQTGRGSGSLTLTVMPKPNLPTGTTITNIADIVFDAHAGGPTIKTPPARNTIDASAPELSIKPLPGSAQLPLKLEFDATDAGSGMSRLTLTPVRNGVALPAIELAPAARSYVLDGDAGTYTFVVTAVDGVGRTTTATSTAVAATKPLLTPDPTVTPEPTATPEPGTNVGPGTHTPAPGPGGGGGSTPGAGGGGQQTVKSKLSITLERAKLAAVLEQGIAVTVSATAPATTCRVSLTASTVQRKKLGLPKSGALGTGNLRSVSSRATVRVKLSARVVKRVKKARAAQFGATISCSGGVTASASSVMFKR
jgi:hypothetical protein